MLRLLVASLALFASLVPPASAEMVNRENFRLLPAATMLERRATCGDFEGDPDLLVYQMVTATCDEPGTRWAIPGVAEVQVTRAWARLGYLAYQVLLLDPDDQAIAAEEWRFEMTPVDDEVWQLDFVGTRWRCRPGHGPADGFTSTPCT